MNYLLSSYKYILIGLLYWSATLNLCAQSLYEQYPSYEALCLHYALQDTAYGMPTNNESIFRFEKTQKGWYVRKMKSDGQSLQTLFYKQVWSASKQAYLKEVDSTALNPQMLQSVT